LQESYATLERKVEERTRQLEVANLAKSRFLAAASHDLRQPLHALGLFVAQLHDRTRAAERRRIVARIDAALSAMNELFNALLDISKLDAGVLTPSIAEFPVARLLKGVETTFAGAALEKGLSLRVVPSTLWVRSDFILLERIVFNLVSNAMRYTSSGGVLVGCRKRGARVRVEVWDTGAGVPQHQQQNIFGEFYRLGEPDRDRRAGLGLGLAIVDRLGRLLDHPIDLTSTLGKGSCFAVAVPLAAARPEIAKLPAPARTLIDVPNGKLVVVIDDDPLVLEGMGGLFRSWGCRVVTADSDGAVLAGLLERDHPPDLIVSDYYLPGGKTGIEVIEGLRRTLSAQIPAFLVSGDTNPEPLREARANGYYLLHKPVDPIALRAMVSQVLGKSQSRPSSDNAAQTEPLTTLASSAASSPIR
jgi:CheY-like chemotaxis protein/anti-sigma regulatory factor (Ser/Thr protein kinase)